MRIDVITLQAVKNYGSVLQAFATKKLFEEYGHEVHIINYVKKESSDSNLMTYWAGYNPIKRIVMFPTLRRWKRVFGDFCSKELNINGPEYVTIQDFNNYPLDADIYCTGSDQVWNSKWNNGVLPMLYLSFIPSDKYKFSFAASFGQENLSDKEIECTKDYISQYKYISVREDSAKKIVEKQYGYNNVWHIVDPTLCLGKTFWREYTKSSSKDKDYILIYNLNRSKEFDKYVKTLSRITGLRLKRLCMRYDQFLRCGESVLIPDVFDFVSLIDNATFVVTDSFHATAFSLNMNTMPICIYPNEFGGRIESILKMTNTLQCHSNGYEDYEVINRSVDFDMVNKTLDSERQRTREFLSMVFKDYEQSKR